MNATGNAPQATPQENPLPSGKKPPSSFRKEKLPFIVATAGEFFGLYYWLHFWDKGGGSNYAWATAILWIGFLIERIAVLKWVKHFHGKMTEKYGFNADGKKGGGIRTRSTGKALAHLIFICATEIVVWVFFYFAYIHYGIWAGFAVLMIGEQLEHSMELGLITRRPMRDYIPSPQALGITLLEGIGGVLWMYFWQNDQHVLGGACLFIGLTIEHVVQGAQVRKDLEKPFREQQAKA